MAIIQVTDEAPTCLRDGEHALLVRTVGRDMYAVWDEGEVQEDDLWEELKLALRRRFGVFYPTLLCWEDVSFWYDWTTM